MFSGGGLFVTNKHPGKTKTFVFKVKEGHQDMLMRPIKKKKKHYLPFPTR